MRLVLISSVVITIVVYENSQVNESVETFFICNDCACGDMYVSHQCL
jgi:hypothetical protein